MFAVKGWSVPAGAPETQTLNLVNTNQTPSNAGTKEAEQTFTNGRHKRKRGNKDLKRANVSATNVADLWAAVIEEEPEPQGNNVLEVKDGEKRRKVSQVAANELPNTGVRGLAIGTVGKPSTEIDTAATVTLSERGQKRKSAKERKRGKKAAITSDNAPQRPIVSEQEPLPSLFLEKPQPKLTPLQASMRQKLISARFRHLNQTLYTTPSAHSLELFSNNPEMFHEYHEGFRRQVGVWPENPVDTYIDQVRSRGKVHGHGHGKTEHADSSTSTLLKKSPLPRTGGICYIADLGCGDAKLTQALEAEKKTLKVQVFSYDLQNPSPYVTKADIASLPLEDNSVDVAIFCLALMGTNWVDFIEEAFRILRWKGELWVAEIKSRFSRVGGTNKRVDHSVGNRKNAAAKMLKKTDEDAHTADLLVEVDGHDDNKGETDIAAFVEVLRKRGFVLHGEDAVDVRNRMFVKMTFVKGLTPMKGKCVPIPKGMEKVGQSAWKPKLKSKFHEDDEVLVSSESSVLKPCVYKLR